MKSKASIASHPIHPMMIAFPIAFGYGALVCDVIFKLGGPTDYSILGWYLSIAAVGSGLLAAVPGFIDYVYVVPPQSSGQKRAATHGIVNSVALGFFLAAWLSRGRTPAEVGTLVLILDFIGAGVITWGGYLGGTLVFRNQIAVDHRYAGAGKWKEVNLADSGAEEYPVAAEAELKLNQMKLVSIGDRRLVLARTDEGLRAFDDHCTHRGGSLADGVMIACTVACPWHGSQFDVRTGAVKAGPAREGIGVYPVSVRDGRVWVRLASAGGAARPHAANE